VTCRSCVADVRLCSKLLEMTLDPRPEFSDRLVGSIRVFFVEQQKLGVKEVRELVEMLQEDRTKRHV
jgi:hypothetical protein